MKVDTIKIKADNALGYKLINAADFDEKSHTAYDADAKAALKERNAADAAATEKVVAERKAQANFGQVDGNGGTSGKNPSGTYSEPTPTDIRYPNKDQTEFENNHGAYVAKSAAELRDEKGLPDAPGGLAPDPTFEPGADKVTKAAAGEADEDDDGEGLTKAEIHADLEAMNVDFDPRAKKADLLALRNEHRAKRDA